MDTKRLHEKIVARCRREFLKQKGLRDEVDACHRREVQRYRDMADRVDRQADAQEQAGHDPTVFRQAAAKLRRDGEVYREIHGCTPS